MNIWTRSMLLPALALTLTGCATPQSGVTYSSNQTRSAQQVAYGTVLSVQAVTIQDDETGLGMAGGGIVGGIAGSTIGGGKGSTLASLGGALAGAALGHMGEKKMRTNEGLEIEIKKDSGQIISVVQSADVVFMVGDRVRLLSASDGTVRVTKQ